MLRAQVLQVLSNSFLPYSNEKFWQSAKPELNNVRLMVKRVFITSDLGENPMPKWISWLRAIVDGASHLTVSNPFPNTLPILQRTTSL